MPRRVMQLGQVGPVPVMAGAAGRSAFKYLVGSVLAGAGAAVIGTMLDGPDTEDSWMERSTFNARMAAMHAGFLMVQCEVGGAQVDAGYGCDEDDQNCLCPGGTRPRCTLPAGKLSEWRALMRSFSGFYRQVGGQTWFPSDNWLVSDPTVGEVRQARAFARSLVRFFIELPSVCPNYTLPFNLADIVGAEHGTTAEQAAEQAALNLKVIDPPWVKGLKYAAWGVGGVVALWAGVTVVRAFRKD